MLTQPNEKIYYPRQKQRHRQTWLSVVEGGPLERGSRGRRASRGPRMKLFFPSKNPQTVKDMLRLAVEIIGK